VIEEDGKAEYNIFVNVYGLFTSFSQAIGFTQEQASNANRFRKKYMMDTGSLGQSCDMGMLDIHYWLV
jgi:hypothetical protein